MAHTKKISAKKKAAIAAAGGLSPMGGGIATLSPAGALPGSNAFDVVGGSEPPGGSTTVPGIPDSDLGGIVGDVVGFFGDLLGGNGGGSIDKKKGFAADADGGCPGLFSVRGPDGRCINLGDLAPGGDPAVTFQQGEAVNGRFGVGMTPTVEVQEVRRCPKGMALGKDGICYDGLSRNSPKREWPMGMKPLLTPGERNAIRIAGRAANKLARSQKTLKKTARALEKAC